MDAFLVNMTHDSPFFISCQCKCVYYNYLQTKIIIIGIQICTTVQVTKSSYINITKSSYITRTCVHTCMYIMNHRRAVKILIGSQ